MKRFLLCLVLMFTSVFSYAKGGFSGGGGRGGFSGGSRSFSSPSRSYSAPSPSYSSPRMSPSPRTSTTTTTTTNRTYSRNVSPGGNFGGMGMGYGYSNGILTGLIIGNMMHPHGTVVYSGPGYTGNALLYPNGQVVNQNGQLVGNYQNGNFNQIQNGPVVAQQAPADAYQPAPIPVKIGPSAGEIVGMVLLGVVCVCLLVVLLAMIL